MKEAKKKVEEEKIMLICNYVDLIFFHSSVDLQAFHYTRRLFVALAAYLLAHKHTLDG